MQRGQSLGVLVVLAGLLAACGGGDASGGNDLDRVAPYTERCVETVCQHDERTCEADATQTCDDCYQACSGPFASPGCASLCTDICQSNCTSCTASRDECETRGVRFDPPPLNQAMQLQALAYIAECEPGNPDPLWYSDFYARSYASSFADVLACLTKTHCDDASCEAPPQPGTVGDVICARQAQCGAACSASFDDKTTAAGVDYLEPVLRPGLVRELWRCAREPDCAVAKSCWEALEPAVGLTRYPDSQ